VHDGLKGNNILMGEDNQPKISDFDCSHIRALSASFSQKTEEDQANAVRWKAREKLVEAGNELSLFKSDVYSLGMTMIEALTQAPPFGMELEEEILNLVVGGEAYEKPEEASESEWRVISQLIAVRIEDRPSTDEAIELISTLITEQTAPGG
jgi:serine/threonine protein kinase